MTVEMMRLCHLIDDIEDILDVPDNAPFGSHIHESTGLWCLPGPLPIIVIEVVE